METKTFSMETKTNESIGTRIGALRRESGMTQRELADKLGVTDKTVSHWERDENLPDMALLPAIAEVFGVSCDQLLRGKENTPAQAQPQSPDAGLPVETTGEGQASRRDSAGFVWLILPLLFILTDAVMLLFPNAGALLLLLWLVKYYIFPVAGIAAVAFMRARSGGRGESFRLVAEITLTVLLIAAESVLLQVSMNLPLNKAFFVKLLVRCAWTILGGFFVMVGCLFGREGKGRRVVFRFAQALLLCVNAFLSFLLSANVGTELAADGQQLALLLISGLLLLLDSAVVGYVGGRQTGKKRWLALAGWLLCVTASEFVALWLGCGAPPVLPVSDGITAAIWAIVSLLIFAPYPMAAWLVRIKDGHENEK